MSTSQMFYMFLIPGAVILLIFLDILYKNASHKWKTRPHIPYWFGVGLLFIAFGLDILAVDIADALKRPISEGRSIYPHQFLQVLFDNQKAHENFSKMIEIIILPIAVALIVMGFTSKAEIKLEEKKSRAKEMAKRFLTQQGELSQKLASFALRVQNDERGRDFLDAWNEIEARRHHLLLTRMDMRECLNDIKSTSLEKEISDETGL